MTVVPEILQSNLETRTNESNGSNQFATHHGGLMAEDMFDTRTNGRATPIVVLLLSGEGLVPIPFPMNLAAQPGGLEMDIDLCRSVGQVGPDIPPGLRRQEDFFEDLTAMHRGIRDRIPPNQLVLLIRVHIVFVPILILALLDGPAGVRVFLPPFGELTSPPLCRALPGFDREVFVARVAWLGPRDQ